MIVVTLARKPLGTATVAANVLAHGTGALNIGASRIAGTTKHNMANGVFAHSGTGTKQDQYVMRNYQPVEIRTDGRWPTNLVLQHTPGCRCVGTKTVKASNQPGRGHGKLGDITSGIGFGGSGRQERQAPFYTDPAAYGMETVPAYHCTTDCIIPDLDTQSGARETVHTNDNASRFFKQTTP